MSKRRPLKSSRKSSSPRTKFVSVYAVFGAALVLASVIAYVVLPLDQAGVLGERTERPEKSRGEGAKADSNARSGKVKVEYTSELSDTEIVIDAKPGKARPEDRGGKFRSGEREGGRPVKVHELESTASSESGEEEVEDEQGNKVKLRKNMKEKILVLPEKAVAALLRNGIIHEVASASSTGSGSAVIYQRVNGKHPVYIIAGTKEEKLFGAIPMTISKKVAVSPETGEVVSDQTPLLQRIIDLLSF